MMRKVISVGAVALFMLVGVQAWARHAPSARPAQIEAINASAGFIRLDGSEYAINEEVTAVSPEDSKSGMLLSLHGLAPGMNIYYTVGRGQGMDPYVKHIWVVEKKK